MFETLDPTLARESSTGSQDLGGLLGVAGERELAFPLREVRVRAEVAGNCCRTIVEQVFDNPYEQALEAVHIFPLPPDGAVTEMELRAGDTVVRAECREREAAERAFDEARASGRRAALLTAERADVHTLRVTNIPPATAVRVRLVLVQSLEESGGAFAWRFPTVVAPRYLPGTPIGHEGAGILPDTDAAPDASRLQPPLRLAGGTRLDLEVEIAGPLASIESSLHAVRTTLGDVVRVAPSARATLDRDFVLRVAPAASAEAASARAYTDGTFTLGIVNAPAAPDAARMPRDVVLVVDISGSMSGQKLDAAKRAMSSVLHGLEKGDRFRLIAFETCVHCHTADLLSFDQSSLAQADRWIADLESFGGTEMLKALNEAFAGDTPRGRLRSVVFITDGQASNEQQLVAAVERHRAGALLFTVGIDTAVNESLLRRLAHVGRGTCELLTPADDIEEAIVSLEARFGSPVTADLEASGLEPARPEPLALFSGRPVTMLFRGSCGPNELRFNGTDAAGHPIEIVAPPATPISFPLGALWARERIAWLEDRIAIEAGSEALHKKEIVSVALAHHIASRFTAFVAVEEHVSNEGARVTVVQPVELPAMWSDSFLKAAADTGGGYLASLSAPLMYDAPRSAAPRMVQVVRELLPTKSTSVPPGVPLESQQTTARSVAREIETALATTQDADGSYGGDVGRTAAALVTLVRLGHTRQRGSRRRVVQKCARWLAQHAGDARARLALDLLTGAESGGELPRREDAGALLQVHPEGEMLRRALETAA